MAAAKALTIVDRWEEEGVGGWGVERKGRGSQRKMMRRKSDFRKRYSI